MARNGEGLFLRNGVWGFRYRDPHTGHYRERSTGKRKKSEAWRAKDQFLRDLDAGSLPREVADWKLKDAAELWLEHRIATRSQKTADDERGFLRQLISLFGADRILKRITLQDLMRYQVKRRKMLSRSRAASKGAFVGPRAVNLELGCLRGILTLAGLWLRFREHYKPLPEPRSSAGQVIPEECIRRLVETARANESWDVAFWAAILAHSTGCRGIEIKRLQMRDVILRGDEPRIRVRRDATKTDAGQREVPLNKIALHALSRLVERAKLLGSESANDYVLPIDRSKHNRLDDPRRGQRGFDFTDHQRSWASAWRSIRKAAGLQNYRFHDLRWSFVTLCAENDVPIEVTISIVGHADAAMTRYYTAVRTRAQQKAVGAVEKAQLAALGDELAGAVFDANQEVAR